ncbi:MAG: serine/threonine-protein kinase, partial [Fimbriiglobus sp.]
MTAFRATRPELQTAPAADTLAALVKAKLLTIFQAKLLNQGRYKGFFLGTYKMLDQIGAGGMGQVFLAEHTSLRRKVAIKVLPARLAEDPSAVERFYREARAAAALDHPNIVRANDVRCERGTYFLVMEYVLGKNLQQMMVEHGGRLGWGEVASYGVQISAALQHAHDRGIVHRDVKPANVVIDVDGTAKVLDMGLARFFEDTQDNLTQKLNGKAMLGTADYVAPEQLKSSTAADNRSDIYALGASLYHMLAGRPPFGGTITAKLMAHGMKDAPPVHEVCPEVPPEFSAVIQAMMAKDPAERYQSAAEVIAALAGFVDGPSSGPMSSRLLPALAAAASHSSADLKPGLSAISNSSYGQPKTPASEIRLELPGNPNASSTAIKYAEPRTPVTAPGDSELIAEAADGSETPAGWSRNSVVIGAAVGGVLLGAAIA